MRDDTRVKTIWLGVKEPVKDENEAELFLEDDEGHLWSIQVKANFRGGKKSGARLMRDEHEIRWRLKMVREKIEEYRDPKIAFMFRYFEGKRDALLWVLGEEGVRPWR